MALSEGAIGVAAETLRKGAIDMVRLVVTQPDAVMVDLGVVHERVVLAVTVAEEDIGKLIGKKGRTVAAMRDLLYVAAQRLGVYRFDFDLLQAPRSDRD